MSRKTLWLVLLLLVVQAGLHAAEAEQLYYAIRSKVLSVKDYTADVKIKVDVAYMKVPLLKGILYFKAPDKMRLERDGGVSILPKKNVNLTLSNLIPTGNVTVIDAGTATEKGKTYRILKVIPEDDQNNIVLTKMWVDEANLLVMRTETTTHNDGTIVMTLEYAAYSKYALPDKVVIHMDLKDYKLPKGMTMDYEDSGKPEATEKMKGPQKGTIEIRYLNYTVNSGLSDAVFQKGN